MKNECDTRKEDLDTNNIQISRTMKLSIFQKHDINT